MRTWLTGPIVGLRAGWRVPAGRWANGIQRPAEAATDWFERGLRRGYRVIVGVVLALELVNELLGFGVTLANWDWLQVTGVVSYLVFLPFALGLPARVDATIGRLEQRQALTPPAQVARLEARVSRRGTAWAPWGGLLTCAGSLALWYAAYGPELADRVGLVVVEIVAAFPVGTFAARAIGYGLLSRAITREGVELHVSPGHLDGAGGLKPIGDLYFIQAGVLGAFAAFVGVWWLITPVAFPRYLNWREPYLRALVVALACELAVFVLPLWGFHRRMVRAKADLRDEADRISRQVVRLSGSLADSDPDERRQRSDDIARLTERYRAIDELPTWPVDPRTRRRFTVRNAALVVPLVANAVGDSSSWGTWAGQLSKVVSGG